MLVVRELLLGPKRFGDLRSGLPGASPNVLSQRLRELESVGVLLRRKLPPPASVRVYELTEWGSELEPVIVALGRWGARSPHLPLDAGMGVDSLILSFRTMFDAASAGDFEATVGLKLGDDVFQAVVADGTLDVNRGLAGEVDAAITTDVGTMVSLVYERRPLGEVEEAGRVEISGERAVIERFITLFPLPERA